MSALLRVTCFYSAMHENTFELKILNIFKLCLKRFIELIIIIIIIIFV